MKALTSWYVHVFASRSKSGVEVNSDDKILLTAVDGIYSLNIQDLEDDDVASYTCSAKNEHGEASESADLTLIGKCFRHSFISLMFMVIVSSARRELGKLRSDWS